MSDSIWEKQTAYEKKLATELDVEYSKRTALERLVHELNLRENRHLARITELEQLLAFEQKHLTTTLPANEAH